MGKGFEFRLVMREIIPFSACLVLIFIIARGALYFSLAAAKSWHDFLTALFSNEPPRPGETGH